MFDHSHSQLVVKSSEFKTSITRESTLDFEMSKKTIVSIPMPLELLKDPENFSQNLLAKAIKFWQENVKFIEKKGGF